MNFIKMHGAGNDYVYIDGFQEEVLHPEALAVRVSDRHFGIGSDGLILILPTEGADARMRMFNADGSEAQMCGNGIRCVAKYVWDSGYSRNNPMQIATGNGVLTLALELDGDGRVVRVEVNMGAPGLKRTDLPMLGPGEEPVVDEKIAAGDRTFAVTCVSMGNPHLVTYVTDVETFPVSVYGPLLENHPLFPERVNVHFVQILEPGRVKQRTWERGAGETLACGTGASAVCVAGVLNGRGERHLHCCLAGGELELLWRQDGAVMMRGPAVEVFRGEFDPLQIGEGRP